MVLGIIDETKRRHTAWFQSEITLHAFGRGEGEFATRRLALCHKGSLEHLLEVVNWQVVVAVQANEVVAVALVVAEKEVLAVHAAIVPPPAFGLFDGFSLGMVVNGIGDVVRLQVIEDDFFAGHDRKCISGRFYKLVSMEGRFSI